jgi:acetone carboxylase gamma subunit
VDAKALPVGSLLDPCGKHQIGYKADNEGFLHHLSYLSRRLGWQYSIIITVCASLFVVIAHTMCDYSLDAALDV